MRNGHKFIALIAVTMLLIAGCGGNAKKTQGAGKPAAHQPAAVLNAGYAALDSKDYNEAIAKADEFLTGTPHGAGSAEALYLKGRSLEEKTAGDQAEAKANLQSARSAYIQALEQMPKQPLESYIRASLANVAYFQDDYPTAISQWTAAYDKLDKDDLKAWALYRIGLSQQRLGQFAQADQTFANVQQLHPSTIPAQRAREHQGARAFFVQLATFASPASATRAAAELQRQGVTASTAADSAGHSVLRVGPISSYSQAAYYKARFAEQYPDAVVLP